VTAERTHGRRRMSGRDPSQTHRAATPLELLFDLTFVVAFGQAANELAHYLAEDHIGTAVGGFAFATFAITWAWINYSWQASAYDTDDWVCRVMTMVAMVGVVILALGLPEMFESLDHGDTLDNGVMVGGYIVMRVAMLGLWTRIALHDPARRAGALTYIKTITASQIVWTALVFADFSIPVTFAIAGAALVVELIGPWLAERVKIGEGTPWHAHHIAERYGLLVIITLGEGVIGTVAALSALVHNPDIGWNADAILLMIAGIGLTFGMWWTYFAIPFGDLLIAHRERSFGWGYGQIPLFGAIAATGAGLHVAAYYLEHHSKLGTLGTVLSVAIPLAIYLLILYAVYTALVRRGDPFHLALLAGTAAVLVLAVVLAATGVSMPVCLVVLSIAPLVTVVGFETIGHRHLAAILADDG
jgi:low temperature requirement protein LtrA